MNGKPIPRNKDGLIERACLDCGKMRYSTHGWPKDRCRHCAKVHRFKNNPAVGLKTIPNIEEAIKAYQSGLSLQTVGEKYGISAMTIRAKILAHGEKTRNHVETTKLNNKKYGNIYKAQAKVAEMCKTGEFQRNMSARLQGVPIEEWKRFITPENARLVASPEYKQWQKMIFKRDNKTCQLCQKTKCRIAAHHIYMKAKYPDKVFDIDNGITLCDKCHYKTIGHEDEYIDCFVSLLLGDLCGKKQWD